MRGNWHAIRILITVMNNLHLSDLVIYCMSKWCTMSECQLCCFSLDAVIKCVKGLQGKLTFTILIFDTYCIASVVLFTLVYQLSIVYSLLVKLLTHPSVFGAGYSSTFFVRLFCMRKKTKKQDSLLCKSINPFPEEPLFQCFKKCWEKKKESCSGEQREKKCQCLKKKSSLIESESTSASSWMSKGVIGDWLQIMNNYIKVGRLPVHVYVCACTRMRLRVMFWYTSRCRGVC